MRNKSPIFLLHFAVLLLLLQGCITPRQTDFLQDINKGYPAQEAPQDYRLISGDQLMLALYVYEEPDDIIYSAQPNPQTSNTNQTWVHQLFGPYIQKAPISGMFASNSGVVSSSNVNGGNNDRRVLDVYSDGTVKIPYLGKIHVEGLTVQEAKTKIAAKFKEFSNFVTNTHIDVDVVLTNKFFSVVGELGNRRVQMNKDRLTIYQALAISGLISEQGNREKVYIIRQISSGLTEYKLFDLRSKDVIDSEYYWIQPNDVIYMPRRTSMFWGKISSFWDVWATLSSVITLGTGIFLIWKQL